MELTEPIKKIAKNIHDDGDKIAYVQSKLDENKYRKLEKKIHEKIKKSEKIDDIYPKLSKDEKQILIDMLLIVKGAKSEDTSDAAIINLIKNFPDIITPIPSMDAAIVLMYVGIIIFAIAMIITGIYLIGVVVVFIYTFYKDPYVNKKDFLNRISKSMALSSMSFGYWGYRYFYGY